MADREELDELAESCYDAIGNDWLRNCILILILVELAAAPSVMEVGSFVLLAAIAFLLYIPVFVDAHLWISDGEPEVSTVE